RSVSKPCSALTSTTVAPSFPRLHRQQCSDQSLPRCWRCASGAATSLRGISETVLEILLPNIKSAKKDMRKARAATIRNRAGRSALRTALKRASAPEATEEQRRHAITLLDRAARKGLIHRNAAARRKSRLARAAK